MWHAGLAWFSCAEHQHTGQFFEEALAVSREGANKREIAWNLGALASNRLEHGGEHSTAKHLLEESIALGRESGDLTPVVYSMTILAHIYASEGNIVLAREILHEAPMIARQIDMRFLMSSPLVLLGDIAARESDWDTAGALYRQTLDRARNVVAQTSMAQAVRHFAALLGARGDHRRALRLLAATGSIGGDSCRGLSPWLSTSRASWPPPVHRSSTALRRRLGRR